MMKWYWHLAGGHVHVRVFMGGAKCGDLCFTEGDFRHIEDGLSERCAHLIREDPHREPLLKAME